MDPMVRERESSLIPGATNREPGLKVETFSSDYQPKLKGSSWVSSKGYHHNWGHM